MAETRVAAPAFDLDVEIPGQAVLDPLASPPSEDPLVVLVQFVGQVLAQTYDLKTLQAAVLALRRARTRIEKSRQPYALWLDIVLQDMVETIAVKIAGNQRLNEALASLIPQ